MTQISTSSPERDLLEYIWTQPEAIHQLKPSAFAKLSRSTETRADFFQLIAQPLLEELEISPNGVRLSLETDGEKQVDELHLHVELADFSPLVIAEIPELAHMSATDLIDEKRVKPFYGKLAKAIQVALQNDQIAIPEKGMKNSEMRYEEKKQILAEIIEKLLEKASQ